MDRPEETVSTNASKNTLWSVLVALNTTNLSESCLSLLCLTALRTGISADVFTWILSGYNSQRDIGLSGRVASSSCSIFSSTFYWGLRW